MKLDEWLKENVKEVGMLKDNGKGEGLSNKQNINQ